MRDRYVPVERDGTVRESQPSGQFMMRRLLESRTDLGMPSDDGHDHDVNVYITQLLCAYGDPHYCLRVAGYLSSYDTTVFERAQKSRSHRFRYTVYKANADHLLMSIGVFQNAEGRSTEGRPAICRREEETFVGRGKTYYDFASAYSQRVFGSTSGVCDVLGKLSAGFEQYVRLLAHLRGEYFEFVSTLSEGEIYHLQRSADAEGLQTLRDEFLDLYSAWRRDPTPEVHARLVELLARIQRIDPDFGADFLH
jgi:hypothetical protein